jgi:hypothetical protein
MMRPKVSRIESWITPDFAWVSFPDAFVIIVSTNDPDIVEFISRGSLKVSLSGSKRSVAVISALLGKETLRGQLQEAIWDSKKLKPADWKERLNTDFNAHLVSAFLLPDAKSLAILVSRSEAANAGDWLSVECKAKANDLLRDHEIMLAEYNEAMALKERQNEEFYSRSDMQPYRDIGSWLMAVEDGNKRPTVTPRELLPLLRKGVIFDVRSRGNETQEKSSIAAIAAIAASGLSPSRDGSYSGIVPTPRGRGARGIVTWDPHLGIPSYPEVRAAVQKYLPSAFEKPRKTLPGRPNLDLTIESLWTAPSSNDQNEEVFLALADLRFDQPDASSRSQELRKEQEKRGFEAIAWYQAYHVWSEETWGIYFDSAKLDDFAYAIFEDFKSSRLTTSYGLASFLAFGLTYAHELFHACVEAASSWLELNTQKGRHLRYSQRVYDKLRETPEWLEEALANWSAWDWFKSHAVQSFIARRIAIGSQLDQIIQASLDLSPPGYRDWRKGSTTGTWRTFATQIVSGKPRSGEAVFGLPLESVIRGTLPFDLQSTDIPLCFVGTGVIAEALSNRPATFNVPTRRELEKALKHFEHAMDPSGGKGGHQKWTGPDRRAFILPTRDPVSPGVFKTFLHHVGIDKATYVQEVRPNL